MFASGRIIAFGGSRSLPASAASLVGQVVALVLAAGGCVAVGCAVGADALVVAEFWARGGSPGRLALFAVGGPLGRRFPCGFWGGSAVEAVVRSFRLGASVRWWAGGGPSVGLRARLFRRSQACVRLAASRPRGGFVGFVVGGWSASRGTWGSVRSALLLGLPVVVFPVGGRRPASLVSSFPRSFRGVGRGSWVPAARSGVWARGFRWVPAG